jgi:hypothetical protein
MIDAILGQFRRAIAAVQACRAGDENLDELVETAAHELRVLGDARLVLAHLHMSASDKHELLALADELHAACATLPDDVERALRRGGIN